MYQKTVDCGALPNNTTKNVAHNISNLKKVISFDGVGSQLTGNLNNIKFPFINGNLYADCYIQVSNIVLRTNTDMSSYTDCYMTIRYTKTTD